MPSTIDFDEVIERRGTNCSKWDKMESLYGVPVDDGIAMWVADMDFRPPQAVSKALAEALEHDIYGYCGTDLPMSEALAGWMERRHNWQVHPKWVKHTYGLVNALALCMQAYSEKGDGVIVFSPVYHAFGRIIQDNERRLVESELVMRDGRYFMDMDALEAQLTGNEKLIFLCSPHNPGGRVWSEAELAALGDFCIKHDLILISDEVHHDLVYPGASHIVAPLAMPNALDRLVVLAATSKTFNLAGCMTGHAVISDDNLRAKFTAAYHAAAISVNRFGLCTATAAYNHGDEWLDELLVYLAENGRIFEEGISSIPGVTVMPLEATYLTWVDFAGTGMSFEEFNGCVVKAGVAANAGSTFGAGGETFLRFNLGTRRALVEEAVARIKDAFADIQ